jgi:hypothetical protein
VLRSFEEVMLKSLLSVMLRSRIYEVDVRFSGFLRTKLELASIGIVGRRGGGQIVFAVQ